MNNIVLLTVDGFFGQQLYPWESLDTDRLVKSFKEKGWIVDIVDMVDVVNSPLHLEDCYIFYTSSQIPQTKAYIDDVLIDISKRNTLIPSYDIFRCHDNKGFQELYKKRIGINSLSFKYYPSPLAINVDEIIVPTVLKKVDGASGLSVWLIKEKNKLKNILSLFCDFKVWDSLILRFKCIIRSLIYKSIKWSLMKKWLVYRKSQEQNRVLLQEFVEGLEFDFKILIFHDKYYVLQRFIRENDFRASGSGNFHWPTEPNEKLLSYAKEVFQKLDSPFASLDICQVNGDFNLIEFQGPHMGPATLLSSKGYFVNEKNNSWNFIPKVSLLEESYCYSIDKYLNKEHA